MAIQPTHSDVKFRTTTFRTPLGPFSIAVDDNDALVATAFGDRAALRGRLKEYHLIDDKRAGRAVQKQVLEYFAGKRRDFDLPLVAEGTAFQHQVWAALSRIPFGKTHSYGELARKLKSGPRAVGRANATNPICLIVPCHRVIGADGSLTGFAFGEEIKQRLLEHEGAMPMATSRAA